MTTAVRPKSGLDWAIETPDIADDTTFSGVLYNIALGARFGWVKIPKSLSLTEQALIANFRTWVDENIAAKRNINLESQAGKEYLTSLGKVVYMYIRAAMANPEVGHFVGKGFDGNDEDAETWLHAGH